MLEHVRVGVRERICEPSLVRAAIDSSSVVIFAHVTVGAVSDKRRPLVFWLSPPLLPLPDTAIAGKSAVYSVITMAVHSLSRVKLNDSHTV